jgi:hypothetical protein
VQQSLKGVSLHEVGLDRLMVLGFEDGLYAFWPAGGELGLE